jgi:hypothetical protein
MPGPLHVAVQLLLLQLQKVERWQLLLLLLPLLLRLLQLEHMCAC